MVKKKINFDDLLKEIKADNSFIFKAEEIKLNLENELNKKERKLEKAKERKREKKKTGRLIYALIWGGISVGIGITVFNIFFGILIMTLSILPGMLYLYFIYVTPIKLHREVYKLNRSIDEENLNKKLITEDEEFRVILQKRRTELKNLEIKLNEKEKSRKNLLLVIEKNKEEIFTNILRNVSIRRLHSKLTKLKSEIREIERIILHYLINGGERNLAIKNFLVVHQIFEKALKIANKPEDVNMLKTKIKLTENEINKEKIKQIILFIEKGNDLKKEARFKNTINELQKALNIANEMFASDEKIIEVKKLKAKMNDIYSIQIKILIKQGNQLKSKEIFNKIIETFDKALDISNKMYSSAQKDQIKKIIEDNFDLIYSGMIKEKIESGNQLRKQNKFDDSIQTFQIASNIAKKMYNSRKKNNEIRIIKSLINQSKIAKIKNTILNLGVKFDRLHIAEIVEKCSESEGDIIDTALEMIKNKEIYAEYFKSTQSVVFDKQANIDEIDRLMATYKEWEEKGVGKK